ncbi:MAG: hypothetical protein JO250_01490 [Armatimonadetes bacterium]|nr:hypothetical protein [Armatimonadota bacterium]
MGSPMKRGEVRHGLKAEARQACGQSSGGRAEATASCSCVPWTLGAERLTSLGVHGVVLIAARGG